MELKTNDRILVLVEYCSSSAHPWTDRLVREAIPSDRPVTIITANPDTLTRRAEGVEQILEEMALNGGGAWCSQGASFGDVARSDWFKVDEHLEDVQ